MELSLKPRFRSHGWSHLCAIIGAPIVALIGIGTLIEALIGNKIGAIIGVIIISEIAVLLPHA
jgi:hypothetical protein